MLDAPTTTLEAEVRAAAAGLTEPSPPASHVHRTQPEHAGLEVEPWIWRAMLTAYLVFFTALYVGTVRDGEARLVFAVGMVFAAMFFGTAKLLFDLKPAAREVENRRTRGVLQTWTGPMSTPAVAAQILTVPLCLAFFGTAIVIIRSLVG